MRVIWLSANRLGYALLKEAIKLKKFCLQGIITLSPHSKTALYDNISHRRWDEFGAKVFKIENLSDNKILLKKLEPDLIIMCGWRSIIGRDIINIPKHGIIGFHPTLLPFGRGSAPIINTILGGYKESGLTMYWVDEGIDSGNIIAQEKFSIRPSDHASDVYHKIIKAGKRIVREYMPLLIKGKNLSIPQDESKSLVFNKPSLKDNEIDFKKETLEKIYIKIKALSKPYQGAYIQKEGKKLIFWKAELRDLK